MNASVVLLKCVCIDIYILFIMCCNTNEEISMPITFKFEIIKVCPLDDFATYFKYVSCLQ